jgi:hypothetical protein
MPMTYMGDDGLIQPPVVNVQAVINQDEIIACPVILMKWDLQYD